MDMRLPVGLLLLTVALSGCTGGDDDGPSAEEQCGIDDRLWTGDECVDHTEPSVIVDGIPSEAIAYITYSFNWTLDNGTRPSDNGEVHSMHSSIHALTAGDSQPSNTTNPEDAPVGTEIVVQTHQNLPSELSGQFTWETPGDNLVLWAYMRINGEHIWQQLSQVSVMEPPRTSETATITITLDPASGGVVVTGDDVAIGLGGAVQFDNQTPWTYEIDMSDCGESDVSLAGQSTGSEIAFFAPDSCSWSGASPLGAVAGGNDPAAITGDIRIRAE